MQLKRDYGNNGMQDSQEYAMTVMRKMQETYNPHKSSVSIYIHRFDKWRRVHQRITNYGDQVYLDLFGAFCISSLQIRPHEWSDLKSKGYPIFETLRQAAQRVPQSLSNLNRRGMNANILPDDLNIRPGDLDSLQSIKNKFNIEFAKTIRGYLAKRGKPPNDNKLTLLARQVTRNQGITKRGDDDRENLTVPAALWKMLEPHIQRQINIARKHLQEMAKNQKDPNSSGDAKEQGFSKQYTPEDAIKANLSIP